MKKLTLLLIVALYSCGPTTESVWKDGCEYLETTQFIDGAFAVSYTHKGNCINPIHIYAKPVVDTVVVPISDTTKPYGFYP